MQSAKKALIIGILLAVAIGLAYPLAVSALSLAGRAGGSLPKVSNGLVTTWDEDHDDRDYMVANYIVVEKHGHDHEEHGDHYKGFGKTVLSALINITSTNIPNTSIGDRAGVVLLKKGGNYSGNYSLLLIVKAKSNTCVYVYHVMANVTNLTIGSDSISISGLIKRSTLPGFTNGSQLSIEVKIGSASIASGSYQIGGDILGLIFFRK